MGRQSRGGFSGVVLGLYPLRRRTNRDVVDSVDEHGRGQRGRQAGRLQAAERSDGAISAGRDQGWLARQRTARVESWLEVPEPSRLVEGGDDAFFFLKGHTYA